MPKPETGVTSPCCTSSFLSQAGNPQALPRPPSLTTPQLCRLSPWELAVRPPPPHTQRIAKIPLFTFIIVPSSPPFFCALHQNGLSLLPTYLCMYVFIHTIVSRSYSVPSHCSRCWRFSNELNKALALMEFVFQWRGVGSIRNEQINTEHLESVEPS